VTLPRILDRDGNEKDWQWLKENYGDIAIYPKGPGVGFRCVLLQEVKDESTQRISASPMASTTLIVKVLDASGRPVDMMKVAWYWPDADLDSSAAPTNGLPADVRPGRAVTGWTNLNGDTGFGMGKGAYYWPYGDDPNRRVGPHATWVYGQNTDVVYHLGMLGHTNHDHFDVILQQFVDDVLPPEEPPTVDARWLTLFQKLDTIIGLMR